jgi:hypothetical protein
MDQDKFIGIKQMMGNDKTADYIISHDTSGVADNVRVAGLQTEQVLNVDTCVHTCNDGDPLGRLYRLSSRMVGIVNCLAGSILRIVLQRLIYF